MFVCMERSRLRYIAKHEIVSRNEINVFDFNVNLSQECLNCALFFFFKKVLSLPTASSTTKEKLFSRWVLGKWISFQCCTYILHGKSHVTTLFFIFSVSWFQPRAYCLDKLCSLYETMFCAPEFVFQYVPLWFMVLDNGGRAAGCVLESSPPVSHVQGELCDRLSDTKDTVGNILCVI